MSDKKIRVLFISSWYPNRVQPALGNFVQKHAEAVSLYADVSVLHVCFDEQLHEKSEVITEEAGNIKTTIFYCKKPSNPLSRICRYLKAYKKGLDIITTKTGSPDIIHANVLFPVGLVFCFLKAFKKIPFVITEHWTGYLPEDPSQLGVFRKYYSRKIVRNASMVMPVSEDLKKAMISLDFKGRYQVIPNVVNSSLFVLREKKLSGRKNILHVSSLADVQKNVSGIINVIKKLSEKRQDFALHIIGDGDQLPFIDKAKQLSLNDEFLFFHGAKKTDEVAEMMKGSDFLLLFSNYENFPCVIAEAYSCGLPVVSTDVGGIAEHLTEKHGLLVKPKDEETLMHAIEKMLDHLHDYDKEFLHDYAVKNFSYESVGSKYSDVYAEILNK